MLTTSICHQTRHNLNTASMTTTEYNSFFSGASPKLQVSKEGKEFARFFKNSLPPHQKVTDANMLDWARTYDRLVRIDKKSRYEIYAVTIWAMLHDGFLSEQGSFLSASILRKKNKEGTTYYDVFLQGFIRAPEETTEILHRYFENERLVN